MRFETEFAYKLLCNWQMVVQGRYLDSFPVNKFMHCIGSKIDTRILLMLCYVDTAFAFVL